LFISIKCTSDSQCLTNKCIKGACIFNERVHLNFVLIIYSYSLIFGGRSYRHCGKALGVICKKNKECGSKRCIKDLEYSYCRKPNRPSEYDYILGVLQIYLLTIALIIILSILSIYHCIKLIL
jgi:hypothetical protein